MRQLKQENHVVPKEYVRRLDVGPVDRSTYRQKASNVGHRAKESGIAPRISGLWRSTADWAISRKRGRCAEESDEAPTNDVPGNRMSICVIIIV